MHEKQNGSKRKKVSGFFNKIWNKLIMFVFV